MIAVTGAGGGVGCTTIAVNVASNLTKLSRRDTVIADFDLLLGSLEECLAVVPDKTIETVVRDLDGLDPAVLKHMLPRHKNGLYMLPHPETLEESARLDLEWSPPGPLAAQGFLRLDRDRHEQGAASDRFPGVRRGRRDPRRAPAQRQLHEEHGAVDGLPGPFEGFGDKIRLVANRTNSPQSEISVKKAEELLKGRLQYQVVNSTKLCRPARTLGVPIDEVDGGAGSKVHQDFVAIAQDLLPFPPEPSRARKKLFASFR